ncbi:hypothetical protein K435DRAFT_963996 [Dendrothele bispora CBS 962.96]|uniref:WW domain-containing protein n=1 Tax=Dendrothele bispora (strain CBS 962.96) TaxID=1314807 RepID=A0A4S8MDZ9_DENBC|nr:hypothetical protein K435DRAFT_963996 [Dendrothele bispora CBS 962.96]
MSQPHSYGSPPPPTNPDTRALPPGWISQYDPNYRAWFYVNTVAQPPHTTWVHPLGPPGSSPPPNQYGPPSGPPPSGPPGGPAGPGYGYGSPPPQQGYGYPQGPQQGYGYGSPPPQGYYNQGYPGQQDRFGGFGGQSYQQQPMYAQQKPQKSGPGMGTALLAGGAGLVGGALIADAIGDHIEDEQREAYQEGYDDGQDGDFDGGDF